ncbi:Hypothetical protein D9617_1g080420 [Elsinoe fawcettii]|nr:Hypothetical protein D9617_1g080420 [Elsinoe fawcettii]
MVPPYMGVMVRRLGPNHSPIDPALPRSPPKTFNYFDPFDDDPIASDLSGNPQSSRVSRTVQRIRREATRAYRALENRDPLPLTSPGSIRSIHPYDWSEPDDDKMVDQEEKVAKLDQDPKTARLIISKSFDPAAIDEQDGLEGQRRVDYTRNRNRIRDTLANGTLPWYPGVPRPGSKAKDHIAGAILMGMHPRLAMLMYWPKLAKDDELGKDSTWDDIAVVLQDNLSGTDLAIDSPYVETICDLQHKIYNLKKSRIVRPKLREDGTMKWPSQVQQEMEMEFPGLTWESAPEAKDLPAPPKNAETKSSVAETTEDGQNVSNSTPKPKGRRAGKKTKRRTLLDPETPPPSPKEDSAKPVDPHARDTSPDEMDEVLVAQGKRLKGAQSEQARVADVKWGDAIEWAKARNRGGEELVAVKFRLHHSYQKLNLAGGTLHPTNPQDWFATLTALADASEESKDDLLIYGAVQNGKGNPFAELVALQVAVRFSETHTPKEGWRLIEEAHKQLSAKRTFLNSSPTYIALLYSDTKLSLVRYLWLATQHGAEMREVMHAAHYAWESAGDTTQYTGLDVARKLWPEDSSIGTINRSLGYDSPLLETLHPVDRINLGIDQLPNAKDTFSDEVADELLSRFEVKDKFFGQSKKTAPKEAISTAAPWLTGGRIGPCFYDRRNAKFMSMNLDILFAVSNDIKAKRFVWCRETLERCMDIGQFYEAAEVTPDETFDFRLDTVGYAVLALENALPHAPKSGRFALSPWSTLPESIKAYWNAEIPDMKKEQTTTLGDLLRLTADITIVQISNMKRFEPKAKRMALPDYVTVAAKSSLVQQGPTDDIEALKSAFNVTIPSNRAPAVQHAVQSMVTNNTDTLASLDIKGMVNTVVKSDPRSKRNDYTHEIGHSIETIAKLRVLVQLKRFPGPRSEMIWLKKHSPHTFDTERVVQWMNSMTKDDDALLKQFGYGRERDLTKIDAMSQYVQCSYKPDASIEMQAILRGHLPAGEEDFQRAATQAIVSYLGHHIGLTFLAPSDCQLAKQHLPPIKHVVADSDFAIAERWSSKVAEDVAKSLARLHEAGMELTMTAMLNQYDVLDYIASFHNDKDDIKRVKALPNGSGIQLDDIWHNNKVPEGSVQYEAAKNCVEHSHKTREDFTAIQQQLYERYETAEEVKADQTTASAANWITAAGSKRHQDETPDGERPPKRTSQRLAGKGLLANPEVGVNGTGDGEVAVEENMNGNVQNGAS